MMLGGLGYVSWHVWQVLPLAPVWRWAAAGTLIVSFAMLFVSLFRIVDHIPLGLGAFCYEVGTSSLIAILYLFIAFLLLDIGRMVRLVPREWIFSNGITACAVGAIVVALLTIGNTIYNNKVREEIVVATDKTVGKPLKIVMASDLHIGYGNRRAELARWVDMINAEHPDLVLFAGDIIDMSHRPLREEDMAAELRRISAPMYACPGNHEFIGGIERAEAFYREAGITLLRDSVAEVGKSTLNASDSTARPTGIYIIGRDDRMNHRRKPLSHLVEGLDKSRFMLLLDHQPYHLERAEQAGIDFQFSGHTHRGQVWPISLITDNVYECSFGHHRRGNTQYYISSGLGIWGAKIRIGTRSEYVVMTVSKGG